ncbi:hypothetical protein N7493_001048 [Penicillium malachiteum]|uniref:NAD-dependent epimerase/dehydratase domain-containing protein n=1 Tax=Penicillium malachiteum TaxID=1324776 RepID=A0AAD6N1F3_9EURO|nr:hypothetical protein N7493_001048 [Penicillium malachiteum]
MAPIDPGSLVLITGGNGFIGAHCIANLLQSNYHVRATVRSRQKAKLTREALNAAGVQSLSNLELSVLPDPTHVDSLVKALDGCQAILHLASSFSYDASPGEFEESLMLPALRGTQAICKAAQKQSSIRRLIVMSSFASVYNADMGLQPGRIYTEKDWSPLTYEDGVNAAAVPIAYRASKVVAERAAWDFVRDNPVQYQLITLCPGMVFGKMIHPISSLSQLNASNQIIWQVLNAGRDGAIPPTKAPVWVDVEDLAEVSRNALLFDTSEHERFLVTSSAYDSQEISDIIRNELPIHRAPIGEPGKRLADTHYSCDSSKTKRLLGVEFRGLRDSIVPLAQQLYAMEEQ